MPPRAKRPERNGTVSTRNGFVLLNQIEKTLGEVLVRDPCRFRESWRGGLEPAGPFGRAMYSEPAAECVSMCCHLWK